MQSDGGPAFPLVSEGAGSMEPGMHPGMSLRDFFAGQAMAMGSGVWPGGHLPDNAAALAANAYIVADAMLAARAGRGE